MLLLRGATCSTPKIFMRTCFNTCSSCEEQHEPRNRKSLRLGFNTCSSCEEQLVKVHQNVLVFLFQYMLLLRGATSAASCPSSFSAFQYMLLLRGATIILVSVLLFPRFQYMLLLRGATGFFVSSLKINLFQYMLLLRGATPLHHQIFSQLRFQYMLLLRGATQGEQVIACILEVSIHAPLARSNTASPGSVNGA